MIKDFLILFFPDFVYKVFPTWKPKTKMIKKDCAKVRRSCKCKCECNNTYYPFPFM